MLPIFFCKNCQRAFELNAGPYCVITEKVIGFDVQNIYDDRTRQPVICPNCNSQEVYIRENGHCTLLRRPTKAKARELQQIRKEGLPRYVRDSLQKWQPEKIFQKIL